MPNARETKRKDKAGTSKEVDLGQVISLFRFPALYDLGGYLRDALTTPTTRGQRPLDPTVLLAAVVAARICGSQPEALKTLRYRHVWEDCQTIYSRFTQGGSLPPAPPNRDQVQYFRDRISDPGIWAGLQERFRVIALAQARQHGNLLPGVVPDWTRPDTRHIVYGDGVILRPYSDVQIHTHPGTLEKVALNSRAKSVAKARVQRSLTDLREDDKEHLGRGINFVAVHTWTSEGRVVLGTDTALGAEQWAALDLLDSLAEMADGGVHTVLWDRALQGWSVDYLMGRHRTQVVGEGVGRKAAELKAARTPRPGEEPARDDLGISESNLTQHTERLAAEFGVPHTKPMAQILRRDVLLAIFLKKEPQPVGTCLYPSEGTYDRVFSRAYDLPPAVHATPDGPCRHDIVIDDSGLYTAEPHPSQEYWVKTSHPKCVSATPFKRPDGRWGRTLTFRIACPSGSFEHTHTWHPVGKRYTPQTPEADRQPVDQGAVALRALCRADSHFHQVFPKRNDAESWNNWFQNTLPHFGRTSSQNLPGQELDFLAAAIANNSQTWSRRPRRTRP